MRKGILLLLLLWVGVLEAQISRQVVDSLSGLPVPFTTVKVINARKGKIANLNGVFRLDIGKEDSVYFSSVGYKDLLIKGDRVGEKVFLTRDNKELDRVLINKAIQRETILLGHGAKLIDEPLYCSARGISGKNCMSWGSALSAEFAEKITVPDSFSFVKLSRIFVPIEPDECYQSLFVSIYENDSMNAAGRLLSRKLLAIEKKDVKKGKVAVSFVDTDIYIQGGKTFFVGVSWETDERVDDCLTRIVLVPSKTSTTISRSLNSPNYRWFPLRFGNSAIDPQYETMFAVELLVY